MLDELTHLAEALGGLDMVQGPGGNASVKDGDGLVVKASGVRLCDLAHPTAHVRVPLALLRAALEGDAQAEQRLASMTPRPSLEVYFHGLGPRVVAHTHPLGALLVACTSTRDPPTLPGACVRTIAYARPGRPLALLVREALATATAPTLLLLRAHGLIVYADTAAEAVALTRAFDEACRARYGAVASVAHRVERYRATSLCAVKGGFVRVLPTEEGRGAVLFPDAAVFCPIVRVHSLDALEALAAHTLAITSRAVLLTDGVQRALLAPSLRALDYAVEVLAAHEVLAEALGNAAEPIADEEAHAIAAMPGELHRLALAGGTSAP
jgi:ribulose-5-phosphate 4-epimerase/fuculose-1-phosphate aldolase